MWTASRVTSRVTAAARDRASLLRSIILNIMPPGQKRHTIYLIGGAVGQQFPPSAAERL
jgi:hypothetical protein